MKIAMWQIEFWVEVIELKPVEIKKAPEERARGESQTPFRKMVK
jgi:hypothetical protein